MKMLRQGIVTTKFLQQSLLMTQSNNLGHDVLLPVSKLNIPVCKFDFSRIQKQWGGVPLNWLSLRPRFSHYYDGFVCAFSRRL